MWDNHEFSWQGWQSIAEARRRTSGPARPSRSPRIRRGSNTMPARVARPQRPLAGDVRSARRQGRADRALRRQWPRRRAEQSHRDRQPQGLPGAALRPAPRPDPHRPAQLPEPRSAGRAGARQAGRRRVPGHVPRGADARSSTAGARTTADIRPRSCASERTACANPPRTRRRRRSSAPRRRPGSRSACAARRRPGRSGATPWARSTGAPIRRTCPRA